MGSHVVEVLRQGLWASLTGGWFYDPHLSLFSNTFHLYIWLLLFLMPFILQLTIPLSASTTAWAFYCLVIGGIFIIIKVVNYKLHMLFDTTERVEAPHENQGTDSWTRAQSCSPISLEQIEMNNLGQSSSVRGSRHASPTDNITNPEFQLNIVTADVERGTIGGAGSGVNVPTITSLEDITSMEDITSLEDLQLDDPKTSAASADISSPDRVRKFRRTVKAMSTQVTPQTSPLIGHRRRASSQERWPAPRLPGTTPPPTLRRQQRHYHSQRVTRHPNVTYRRRSKSVLDSPHGSHMLVGESRAEEQPPLTLEWAGYPHPSPRPRHRHRQASLEEPLPGSVSRRYSLDLKPARRGRPRDRLGIGTQSSNLLLRSDDSERLEDINALRDNLLSQTQNRKISTVSEPADPYGESPSSDDSTPFMSLAGGGEGSRILGHRRKSSDAPESLSEKKEEPAQRRSEAANPDSDSERKSANDIETSECAKDGKDLVVGGGDFSISQDSGKEYSAKNKSSNNNDGDENTKNANSNNQAKMVSGRPPSGAAINFQPILGESPLEASSNATTASLSVVEEAVEVERPRNPALLSQSAEVLGDETRKELDQSASGAIPKRGPKYDRPRGRHLSADDAVICEEKAELKDTVPSPNSSVSGGSENTSLLVAAKSHLDDVESNGRDRVSGASLKRRPAVRRHTNADIRRTVRQARYYDSRSSWSSRRSSRSRRYSDSEPALADDKLAEEGRPPISPIHPSSEQWHYFRDCDGFWFKYTFDSASDGLPVNLGRDFKPPRGDGWAAGDDGLDELPGLQLLFKPGRRSSSTERPCNHDAESNRAQHGSAYSINVAAYMSAAGLSSRRRDSAERTSSEPTIQNERLTTPSPGKPKQFYRWKLHAKIPSVKIWLDRLSLLALLDRNVMRKESVLSILLAVLVAIFAGILLSSGYYEDVYILMFCFVVAGCQYSLLKSVQPDAASPTHGYNSVIVYSRAFYFCVISLLIILLDVSESKFKGTSFGLYGVDMVSSQLLKYAGDLLKVLMLCFPLVFTFGLLPQVNTFLQFLLEQIEVHIFGGNGTTSLPAAAYTVLHSTLAVTVLYGVAFVPAQLIDVDIAKAKELPSHVTFSVFCGVLLSLSYHLSRMSSDPTHLWMLLKSKYGGTGPSDEGDAQSDSIQDPLPSQIRRSMYQRLRNDLIVCVVIAIFVFGIHVSTVFGGSLQPTLHSVLCYVTAAVGFLVHYLMGQLRKEYPWLCCSHPLLKTPERSMFNVAGPATITWFERLYVWMRFMEKNVLYPAVFLSGVSISAPALLHKFGIHIGLLVLVISSMKALRSSFSDTSFQYCVLALTQLAFTYDYRRSPESNMFILNYALVLIFYSKFVDFYLKCKFIFVYIAPWQLAWGSAFHAFAQPLSVPHACMLFVQAGISALLYTPLSPLLGSAIFINSYMRPIKFWEKDYNTKRVDHSNIRLASQVDNSLGSDDNNLNSIFYEHLTRSLQKMLCGDLMMGRWGEAHQGDMFIMASDYLNALVHVVEMANGLVTFQLRGLEFRGTYCQQREVEAITEGVDDDAGLCCCNPGHLPHFLSANAAFGERWLAWEVTVTMYILDGYSITDNNAAGMLQLYELRKVLITYYVKSVIFYTIRSPKLLEWLEPEGVTANIDTNEDLASVFSADLDEDFDRIAGKVTRKQFSRAYLTWIQHCVTKRTNIDQSPAGDTSTEERLVSLCYALSLVARRALATAAHNNCASVNVEFFLHGLHSLFKGDFRITGPDEWVFKDIEFLRKVISPAIKMALKLHQDHFTVPDEYSGHAILYDTMVEHGEGLVITHEADPDWRNAVLANRPSLLALRHVFDEGSNVYKIIMLNKRHLSFRIIKVNRECVRGLWAGQQQELVFLRNRNPERGSIQNAKQALRNMINSSCDQPIGYPIYVSPLTTSYAGTNDQLTSVLFGEVSLYRVKRFLTSAWQYIRFHCGQRCRNLHSPNARAHHSPNALAAGAGAAPPSATEMRELSSFRGTDVRPRPLSMSRQPSAPKPSTSSLPLGITNLTRPNGGSAKDKHEQPTGASNYLQQQETSFNETGGNMTAEDTPVKVIDMTHIVLNTSKRKRAESAIPSKEMRKNGGHSQDP